MNGKDKCKILKQIRQEIADANDIPYVTENCRFHGNCKGTCPKCESELRYLEAQLENRRRKGLAVAAAGLSLFTSVAITGCQNGIAVDHDKDNTEDVMDLTGEEYIPDRYELSGYVPYQDYEGSNKS